MLIHCTKRACERLKITPSIIDKEYNPLYSWRLNVVEEGRKRLVVFMNDASRYCIALDGIKAKDWSKLSQLFLKRLREVMLAEQINPEIIEHYLSEAGEIEYYRNNSKQMTAWLNKACEAACLGYRNRDNDVDISLYACRYLVGTKNEKDYWEPSERFHARLTEYGMPLKCCRAFEFDIRLQTENGWVCRTIIVPAEITFEQLATVIKRAYGWWRRENQLHFLLYADNGFPEFYLCEERDPSTFDLPSVVMTHIKLSEYLPKHKAFRFLYDYRADWILFINLTAEYDNYVGAIPHLESGKGNAPPEYVGGSEGYGYEEFDIEKSRRNVERALKW